MNNQAPWLAFYGSMAPHIDYPEKTMWQMVFDAARQWPENTAYDFQGRRTPFKALPGRIERVARALLGARRGPRRPGPDLPCPTAPRPWTPFTPATASAPWRR